MFLNFDFGEKVAPAAAIFKVPCDCHFYSRGCQLECFSDEI